MGTLFGFVSDEIMNKMGVLRQLQSSEYKEHFKTMKGMIGYERSSNLLYKSGYTSGSRTLLRLHRGLGKSFCELDRFPINIDHYKIYKCVI